jgi:5-methylcytosine-specific restriction protein A
MPIPVVAAEALADAMARFDRDFRDGTEWASWEQNKAYLYAIEHDGQRYPVKQIISMATGMPVSDFIGRDATGDANQYVVARGFALLRCDGAIDWMR